MSTSIVIVLDENADKEKIKNFWTPVQLKYKDRPQFDFVFCEDMNEGIRKAKNNVVFITPWNMIPTYQTLIAIENLTERQCLLPQVHGTRESANAFSIVKSSYKGENMSQWITAQRVVDFITTTVYEV